MPTLILLVSPPVFSIWLYTFASYPDYSWISCLLTIQVQLFCLSVSLLCHINGCWELTATCPHSKKCVMNWGREGGGGDGEVLIFNVTTMNIYEMCLDENWDHWRLYRICMYWPIQVHYHYFFLEGGGKPGGPVIRVNSRNVVSGNFLFNCMRLDETWCNKSV